MGETIHIVGAGGIIGRNLREVILSRKKLLVHEAGKWNFESVSKGDFVFYLRAMSSPFAVMNDPDSSRSLNVTRTRKAISEMLMKGAKVVFASSDVVYGETLESYASEKTPTNPYGEYANQKASIETFFKDETNFLSLRISSVMGQGSKLQKLLANGGVVEIFDPVIRTPIHIKDLRTICFELIHSNFRDEFPYGVLNAGGNASMSHLEMAILEAKFLGVNPPVAIPRTTLDKACRPGIVRMSTRKAQEFARLSLDISRHYE